MIPILYAPDEQDFTSNGLGRLADCRRFEVTEERNGIYECEFEYPVTGPLFSELKYGYYVYATHDESKTPQAFEIYSREATLDGWATFRAWHISYQLNDIIVRPFTASGIADAMSKIPANEITPGPFTFWTDKTTAGDFKLDVPKAARALLGGSQGSLLDVFGKGDYEFDMHAVKLHIDRGADRGVSIRYGKNLASLDQKLEGGDIVNGVVPFWQSTDGETVWLDFPIYGGAIAYPVPLQTQSLEVLQTHVPEDIYAQYVNAKVQALDLSGDFDEVPTPEQLAERARAIMAGSTAYQLEENLEIDFVALWQTEEYKSVAALQRVFLCDTVSIFYEKLGITASAKVIKTVYDTLRERYSSIELGEPKTTLAQQIQKTVTDGVVAEVKKTFPDNSAMQAAIAYATNMIQGGLGGYVVIEPDASGHPEEILIMDTPDKATAVNVWRWNSGGLGHSSTGYNGPYSDIALTADGKINANLITTGTLDASVVNVENINADNIVAGTIADNLSTPKNYWNLTTGEFNTTQGTIGSFNIDQTGLHSGQTTVGNTGSKIYPGFSEYSLALGSTTQKIELYPSWLSEYVSVNGGAYQQAFLVRSALPSGIPTAYLSTNSSESAHIVLQNSSQNTTDPIYFSYNTKINGDLNVTGQITGTNQSITATASTNVTISSQSIKRFGNYVCGKISFTTSATINAYGYICTNIPAFATPAVFTLYDAYNGLKTSPTIYADAGNAGLRVAAANLSAGSYNVYFNYIAS